MNHKITPIIAALLVIIINVSIIIITKKHNEVVNTTIDSSVCISSETSKTNAETTTTPEPTTEQETTTKTITETSTDKEDTTKLTETTEAVVYSTTKNGIKKVMGTFKVTVYTPNSSWGYATAYGKGGAKHLQTCAVDPNVIPLGSYIEVNGLTLYCNDTGSAVKGNVIDIFYDGSESEAEAWGDEFGMRHEVYMVA